MDLRVMFAAGFSMVAVALLASVCIILYITLKVWTGL